MNRLCGCGLIIAMLTAAAAGQSRPVEGLDEAAPPQPARVSLPATAPASQPDANVAAGPGRPIWAKLSTAYLRVLPTWADGRTMPADTLARQVMRQVTGEPNWNGLDPTAVLMAWTWFPLQQESVPMVLVEDRDLREKLALPAGQSHFSYSRLSGNEALRRMVEEVAQETPDPRPQQPTKRTPLQEAAMALWGRLLLLKSLEDGEVLRFVPAPQDPRGPWVTINEIDRQPDVRAETREQIRANWERMRTAFAAGDQAAFTAAGKDHFMALEALQAPGWPGRRTLILEVLYNMVRPIRGAWIVCLLAMATGLLAMAWPNRWIKRAAWVLLLYGLGLTTSEILLRWKLGGAIPMATAYEWVVVMAWIAIVIGIVTTLRVRKRAALATTAAVAAVILLIADIGPLSPQIPPQKPSAHSRI